MLRRRLVRWLATVPLAVLLVAGMLTADASANVLSLARAKARTIDALVREQGIARTVVVTCRRKTAHRVRCSIHYADEEITCTGLVFVELSHRTRRIKVNTADVDCKRPLPPVE